MSNPFYGAANYGLRSPYPAVSTPPIGTQGVGMTQGFNPTPYVQQPIMQPRMNGIQQNLQSMIPQSNIIWIDDESQIANFPTGMGWQQWFGLKNEQVMFVRETDMNGVTQPIRKVRYDLDMAKEESQQTGTVTSVPAQVQTQNLPQQSAPDGVTREEFNKLSDAVNMMTEKLSDLLK